MKGIALACAMIIAMNIGAQEIDRERPLHTPLQNSRAEVLLQYEYVSTLDLVSRKAYVRTLTLEMRSDLWIVQLTTALRNNKVLTAAQRTVIRNAIGLIAEGVFTDEQLRRQTLDDLGFQIRQTFSPELATITFGQLGSAETVSSGLHALPPTISRVPRVMTGDCDCHQSADFCDTITNPNHVCRDVGINCTPTVCCCGWLWMESCDGLCSA
jgi:hypothetical protein